MKAIKTYMIPCSERRPRRMVATTFEHKQRILISRDVIPANADPHEYVARRLLERMGWQGAMVGGGFPDGSMVWVFEDKRSPRVAARHFRQIEINTREGR